MLAIDQRVHEFFIRAFSWMRLPCDWSMSNGDLASFRHFELRNLRFKYSTKQNSSGGGRHHDLHRPVRCGYHQCLTVWHRHIQSQSVHDSCICRCQFSLAYSCIAQFGLYVDRGFGQFVRNVGELLAGF